MLSRLKPNFLIVPVMELELFSAVANDTKLQFCHDCIQVLLHVLRLHGRREQELDVFFWSLETLPLRTLGRRRHGILRLPL